MVNVWPSVLPRCFLKQEHACPVKQTVPLALLPLFALPVLVPTIFTTVSASVVVPKLVQECLMGLVLLVRPKIVSAALVQMCVSTVTVVFSSSMPSVSRIVQLATTPMERIV